MYFVLLSTGIDRTVSDLVGPDSIVFLAAKIYAAPAFIGGPGRALGFRDGRLLGGARLGNPVVNAELRQENQLLTAAQLGLIGI